MAYEDLRELRDVPYVWAALSPPEVDLNVVKLLRENRIKEKKN